MRKRYRTRPLFPANLISSPVLNNLNHMSKSVLSRFGAALILLSKAPGSVASASTTRAGRLSFARANSASLRVRGGATSSATEEDETPSTLDPFGHLPEIEVSTRVRRYATGAERAQSLPWCRTALAARVIKQLLFFSRPRHVFLSPAKTFYVPQPPVVPYKYPPGTSYRSSP